MAVKNNTIVEKAYLEASNDFQQRIPDPTQSTLDSTIEALFQPMNNRFYNEFIDILVNRIGMTLVRNSKWENPLAAFKGGKLNFGSTIQELIPAWIKAHSYEDDIESLLKVNRPVLEQSFHSLNRQDRYDISINREELRQAFTEEFGLNNLVSTIMQVPYNSDNYDEYKIMVELISKYENKWGFFKQHISSIPKDEETGKEFLRLVRKYTGMLHFPSTLYNAKVVKNIPVFAKKEDLILLMTPEVNANISVEVLASLFNVDKADLQVKTIMIDEFPIPNACALLTTKDWFVCHDKEYTATSFYNPQTLGINHYLHHWEVMSCSPFVPAILFTTDDGTEVETVKEDVTGFELNAAKTLANAGEKVALFPSLQGTYSGTGGSVAPESSASYSLRYEGSTIITGRTFVDRNNVLHIQGNAVEGDVLVVTATSTYSNPSGETPELIDSVRITIGGSSSKKKLVNDITDFYINDSKGTKYLAPRYEQGYYDLDDKVQVPVYRVKVYGGINEDVAGDGCKLSFVFGHASSGNITFLTNDYEVVNDTEEIFSPHTCNLKTLVEGGYKVAFFDNGQEEPIEYGAIFDLSNIQINPVDESIDIKSITLVAGKDTGSELVLKPEVPEKSDLHKDSYNPMILDCSNYSTLTSLQLAKVVIDNITTSTSGVDYQLNYKSGDDIWRKWTEARIFDFTLYESDRDLLFCVMPTGEEVPEELGTEYFYKLVMKNIPNKKAKKTKKTNKKGTKKTK